MCIFYAYYDLILLYATSHHPSSTPLPLSTNIKSISNLCGIFECQSLEINGIYV